MYIQNIVCKHCFLVYSIWLYEHLPINKFLAQHHYITMLLLAIQKVLVCNN